MRRIIGTAAAVAALGIAASTTPAAAQHHGGFGGFHGGMGAFHGGMGSFHGGAVAPSVGMGRMGPALGAGPRSNGFAPGGNFAARTGPITGWNGRPGFRPGFRGRRNFGAFGFGFGGPFWYDYGPDYAYDYDYGYYGSCYNLRRVFVAGAWRLRRVWVCG
jgi:hypothetical protein